MIRAWLDLPPAGIFAVLFVLYFGMSYCSAMTSRPLKKPAIVRRGCAVLRPPSCSPC